MWKAKRTPDEPRRLVWVCGEVRRAMTVVWIAKRTPDEPKKLVCVCGEVRRATTVVWKGKQKGHQTSLFGSSGCVER